MKGVGELAFFIVTLTVVIVLGMFAIADGLDINGYPAWSGIAVRTIAIIASFATAASMVHLYFKDLEEEKRRNIK